MITLGHNAPHVRFVFLLLHTTGILPNYVSPWTGIVNTLVNQSILYNGAPPAHLRRLLRRRPCTAAAHRIPVGLLFPAE